MKQYFRLLCLATTASLAILAFSAPAFAKQTSNSFRSHHICTTASTGFAQCSAIQVDSSRQGLTPNASSPSGLNPADLQAAYNLPSATAGSGQTIAVVDAYNDPNYDGPTGPGAPNGTGAF